MPWLSREEEEEEDKLYEMSTLMTCFMLSATLSFKTVVSFDLHTFMFEKCGLKYLLLGYDTKILRTEHDMAFWSIASV